jgi:Uma2 family endonuclease
MEAQEFQPPIHRINVAKFHRMLEAGVLTEDDRVELIDGEMRDMPPIGPIHSGCTIGLIRCLTQALGDLVLLNVQGPLALDGRSELYPDLLVLKLRDDLYQTSHPTADDVWLLIEVSDTTLDYDRKTKLPKYARAGVPLYWIVDVPHKTIHEYRAPDRFARHYRQTRSVSTGAIAATLAGVSVQVAIADLFRF